MNRRLIFSFLFAIVVAFLFWSSSLLQSEFWRVVDFFNVLVVRNELLAMVLFVLSSVAAALVSPLTNIPLVPIAVVFWGPAITALLLLFGWLVGDMLAYFVGRYFGRRVVFYFVHEELFEQWSRKIKEHTTFLTALLLRLALPAELGYAFGMVRYPIGAYALITVLSELPFAIISTYASEAVLLGNAVQFLGFAGILLGIIFITIKITNNNRKKLVV